MNNLPPEKVKKTLEALQMTLECLTEIKEDVESYFAQCEEIGKSTTAITETKEDLEYLVETLSDAHEKLKELQYVNLAPYVPRNPFRSTQE